MGCSECNRLYYGTVFSTKKTELLPSYRYIYLGKCGHERVLYSLTLKEYTNVDDNWIKERDIIVHDYHGLYVIYRYKDSYGLTGVHNLLKMEEKTNKRIIREGIITVVKADGIEQARKMKKKVVERWEEENILPFN